MSQRRRYLLVSVGSIQATGQNALAALSAEFGGTPLTAPGVDDGEVTADQSVQMVAALAVAGVPTAVYF